MAGFGFVGRFLAKSPPQLNLVVSPTEGEICMTHDKWPFPDPLVAGVREHYERIREFLELARNTSASGLRFRCISHHAVELRVVRLHQQVE